MGFDPDATSRRLDQLVAEAKSATPERPISSEGPVVRARRAIRVRYTLIIVGFVALTVVLTAGAVAARDLLDDDDPGPTGSTANGATTTGPTGPTPTGPGLPVVTIESGPDELTDDPDEAFVFTIDPPGTPVCSLNDVPLDTCESGAPIPAAEGTNTFEIFGVDDQNRAGESVTYAWVLDTGPPEIEPSSVELGFTPLVDDPACFVDSEQRPCTEIISGLSGPHTFSISQGDELDLTWSLPNTPPMVSFVNSEGGSTTSTIRLAFSQTEPGTPECFSPDGQVPCELLFVTDTITVDTGGSASRDLRIVPIDEREQRGTEFTFTWTFEVDNAIG